MPRTARLEEAERALGLALVVMVAGNRQGVSASDIFDELSARFRLGPDAFFVHRRRDGKFLLRFADEATRARVAVAPIRAGRFRLILHPWSRLAGAEPITLRISADIEITGIPEHGWDISSAVQLLSPFCLIDRFAPETLDGSDMSVFRLSAWMASPDVIYSYAYTDADPNLIDRFAVELLCFPVSIHVQHAADFRLPGPPPPPPPTAGEGDAGDHSPPPCPDAWPCKFDFPRSSGGSRHGRGHGHTSSGQHRRR